MTDHDPRSPWAAHAAVPPAPPETPSHAYVAPPDYPPSYPTPYAGTTYAGTPHAPTPYGPTPYGPTPIEVRVEAPRAAGRGLAVTGVVLGGLALLGVLLLVIFTVATTFAGFGEDPGGGGGYGPMRGTIAPVKGSPLAGQALADEVSRKVRDDGGYPEGVTCPTTAVVAKDVTTVCHGTDAGEDSSFVVFFEDGTGAYTLLEI